MAIVVYCFLLLLAVCGAIQQRSPRGADYSNYEEAGEEEVKIIFPNSFKKALPNIQSLQKEIVSLMNKTLISQENVEDKLGNNEIVSLMNKSLGVLDKTESHLETIAASQNESIILNNMTMKSQNLIESHLQNMDVILPDIQDSQNDMVSLMNETVILQENIVEKLENKEMVSLMNKTLSVFDKSEHHLENIVLSHSETLKSQHLIETRLENLEVILENITGLIGTMVNLLQNQVTPTQPAEEFYSTIPAADETNTELQSARDCQDLVDRGIESSGPYVITPPDGLESLNVYCDFIDNEGWTVFQRRFDGSVDFYRNWTEYENGFGDSNGEYWLGLKNIHRLISDGNTWALRIDFETFDGESAYAVYDTFSISDAASNYRLAVGEYNGTAGDSLKTTLHNGNRMHNGMQFSTFDRDNDRWSSNCARSWEGAFWYNACHVAHLNGKYLGRAGNHDWKGMIWYTWKQKQSLKTSEMKIRRVL